MNSRSTKSMLSAAWLIFWGTAGNGQTMPIAVEISTPETQVRTGEPFVIFTTLRNKESDEQALWVWSCSYPVQWASDNPDVHISDIPCLKNDTFQMKMAPGKIYERQLEIHIDVTVEPHALKAVTFRLNFETALPNRLTPAVRIWSNALTLNVTE